MRPRALTNARRTSCGISRAALLPHTAFSLFPSTPKAVYSNLPNNIVTFPVIWIQHAQRLEGFSFDNGTGAYSAGAPRTQWGHKLLALLSTPFASTIYLDTDVYLLHPRFVHAMSLVLNVSDLTMPHAPRRSPPFDVLPWGCSAMIAYSQRALSLFATAYQMMAQRAHRELDRQGDQEYIYFAWRERHNDVRTMQLPADFFCPQQAVKNNTPEYTCLHMMRDRYSCWALHSHGFEAFDQIEALQDQAIRDPINPFCKKQSG